MSLDEADSIEDDDIDWRAIEQAVARDRARGSPVGRVSSATKVPLTFHASPLKSQGAEVDSRPRSSDQCCPASPAAVHQTCAPQLSETAAARGTYTAGSGGHLLANSPRGDVPAPAKRPRPGWPCRAPVDGGAAHTAQRPASSPYPLPSGGTGATLGGSRALSVTAPASSAQPHKASHAPARERSGERFSSAASAVESWVGRDDPSCLTSMPDFDLRGSSRAGGALCGRASLPRGIAPGGAACSPAGAKSLASFRGGSAPVTGAHGSQPVGASAGALVARSSDSGARETSASSTAVASSTQTGGPQPGGFLPAAAAAVRSPPLPAAALPVQPWHGRPNGDGSAHHQAACHGIPAPLLPSAANAPSAPQHLAADAHACQRLGALLSCAVQICAHPDGLSAAHPAAVFAAASSQSDPNAAVLWPPVSADHHPCGPPAAPRAPCPYASCPGIFRNCGAAMVLFWRDDGGDVWHCPECRFVCCSDEPLREAKLALEMVPPLPGVAPPPASFRVVPIPRATAAVQAAGGVTALLRRAGVPPPPAAANRASFPPQHSDAPPAPHVAPLHAAPAAAPTERHPSGGPHPTPAAAATGAVDAVYPVAQYAAVEARLQKARLLLPGESGVPWAVRQCFSGSLPRCPAASVDAALVAMPPQLRQSLLPFQLEGVRYGLERHCRCLIGDEMGVGKSLQAIAMAACHMREWTPLLVLCPASIRLLWAEELEKWLPGLPPSSITLIRQRADWRPDAFPQGGQPVEAARADGSGGPPPSSEQRSDLAADVSEAEPAARQPSAAAGPKVLISSYQMLRNLSCSACSKRGAPQRKPGARGAKSGPACPGFPACMAAGRFSFVIVDESHHMRSTNGEHDSTMTEAMATAVRNAQRAVLLSGTPSVTRPFDMFCQLSALQPRLLPDKFAFAFRYCQRRLVQARRGSDAKRWCNNGGERLLELSHFLHSEFMVRRLKKDVLQQLPGKSRQVVRLERPDNKAWAQAEAIVAQALEDASREKGQLSQGLATQNAPQGLGDDAEDSDSESDEECGAWRPRRFALRGAPQGDDADEPDLPRTTLNHVLGLAKLPQVISFLEDFALSGQTDTTPDAGGAPQPGAKRAAAAAGPAPPSSASKLIIFAHHKTVMNQLSQFLNGTSELSSMAAVPFVRIDGATLHDERLRLQRLFHHDPSIRVALLSMSATSVGLDFSCASHVVFAEVPETSDVLLQAEARAHRITSKAAVNIYVLAVKSSWDERTWRRLAESLETQSAVLEAPPAAADACNPEGGGGEGRADAAAASGSEAAPPRRALHVDAVHELRAVLASDAGTPGDCDPSTQGGGLPADGGPALAAAGEAAGVAAEGLDAARERSAGEPTAMASPPRAAGAPGGEAAGSAVCRAASLPADGSVTGAMLPSQRGTSHADDDGVSAAAAALTSASASARPNAGASQGSLREDRKADGPPDSPKIVAASEGDASSARCESRHPPEPSVKLGVDACVCDGVALQREPTAVHGRVAAIDTFFAISRHTGSVCLFRDRQGLQPWGLRFPLMRLEPQAGQAPERTVDHLMTLLEGLVRGGEPAAIVKLPWGGVACLQPPGADAGALRAAVAAAVEFAARWKELSAMEAHGLYESVLEVSPESGVAPAQRSVDVTDGEDPVPSFLRSIGRRNVRLQLDEKAGERWQPVTAKIYNGRGSELLWEVDQPFSAQQRRLCCYCKAPVPNGDAYGHEAVLPSTLFLFCSHQCDLNYLLLKNSSSIRKQLFAVERGVCQMCKLDTQTLISRLRCYDGSRRSRAKRLKHIQQLAPGWFATQKGRKAAERLAKHPHQGNAWQADHIRAVYEGGGLCELKNLRTLCTLCHGKVTERQASDRAKARHAAHTPTLFKMFAQFSQSQDDSELMPVAASRRAAGGVASKAATSPGEATRSSHAAATSADVHCSDARRRKGVKRKLVPLF